MKRVVIVLVIVVSLGFIIRRFVVRSPGSRTVSQAVSYEDLALTTGVSGRMKAVREASLSFPISGKLIQVASQGAEVKEGEVVALLDTFDLYSAYQAAAAFLNKARSGFSNAVETKAELDATYAGRESDNIVKAKLAIGKTNVEAAAAAVENAKFLADQALAALTKAIIRAPFTGAVVKSSYKIGEVAPGAAEVIKLFDLSSFYFEAEADEVDVGSLKISQAARITLDAFPNREFTGKITYVDDTSHTTASGGTAYDVKISFSAAPEVIFRSGLNGEARIIREVKKGVLTVPAAFVYQKDGKSFIQLSRNDGRSDEREIKVGEFVEGRYEVLEGLKAGQVVVRKLSP